MDHFNTPAENNIIKFTYKYQESCRHEYISYYTTKENYSYAFYLFPCGYTPSLTRKIDTDSGLELILMAICFPFKDKVNIIRF